MIAEEVREGLTRLGVVDANTMPYAAHMNGKIEVLWGSVEGQLLAMLENVQALTLETLNEATQAWVEYCYNRSVHSETGQTPRLSDGTIILEGHRFEVPNRYRHLQQLSVRYAHWDLTHVHLADERTGEVLCRLFPQDKLANARGIRRPLEPVAPPQSSPAGSPLQSAPHLAPLLSKLLSQQAATGLPPPYLSLQDTSLHNDTDDESETP